MDTLEISLARAYLAASGQDPVTALIRSVKDLARVRRMLAGAAAAEFAAAPCWTYDEDGYAAPATSAGMPISLATSARIS
jgi:hypothetical protein